MQTFRGINYDYNGGFLLLWFILDSANKHHVAQHCTAAVSKHTFHPINVKSS